MNYDIYIESNVDTVLPHQAEHKFFKKQIAKSLIRLNVLFSITSLSTPIHHDIGYEPNLASVTSDIHEFCDYSLGYVNEIRGENLIDMNIAKKIKVKIGKVESLVFESIEDKNGFI